MIIEAENYCMKVASSEAIRCNNCGTKWERKSTRIMMRQGGIQEKGISRLTLG
jgi:hypothetical protein